MPQTISSTSITTGTHASRNLGVHVQRKGPINIGDNANKNNENLETEFETNQVKDDNSENFKIHKQRFIYVLYTSKVITPRKCRSSCFLVYPSCKRIFNY